MNPFLWTLALAKRIRRGYDAEPVNIILNYYHSPFCGSVLLIWLVLGCLPCREQCFGNLCNIL